MNGKKTTKISRKPKTRLQAAKCLGISPRELYNTLKRIGDSSATHERHGRKLLFYPEHIDAIRYARANDWKLSFTKSRKSLQLKTLSARMQGVTQQKAVEIAKKAGVQKTKGSMK